MLISCHEMDKAKPQKSFFICSAVSKIISNTFIIQDIDVVGDGSSLMAHRKKLSAFTIESILSGMAEIKVNNQLLTFNILSISRNAISYCIK